MLYKILNKLANYNYFNGGKINEIDMSSIIDILEDKIKDITGEIIYIISNDYNNDSYLVKIGKGSINFETGNMRLDDYGTYFPNGIYLHGLIFREKNTKESIDKIEKIFHEEYKETKFIMKKRSKITNSSTNIRISKKSYPFGEWFWVDIIDIFGRMKYFKNYISDFTSILFIKEPFCITQKNIEISWLEMAFKEKIKIENPEYKIIEVKNNSIEKIN
jgi:hypothetical protein